MPRRDGQPSQRRRLHLDRRAPSLRPVRNMPSSPPKRHVHAGSLRELADAGFRGTVLVEKPIFSRSPSSVANYPFAQLRRSATICASIRS